MTLAVLSWPSLAVALAIGAVLGAGVVLLIRRPVRAPNERAAAPTVLPAGTSERADGTAGVASSAGRRRDDASRNGGWTGIVSGDRAVRVDDLGVRRLDAFDGPHGRTWAVDAPGLVAVAGWSERRAGRGEDAEPTLRLHPDGRAVLGVYDGAGGAGAAVARRLRDGTELSGAFVASRLVRDVVERWTALDRCPPSAGPGPATAGPAGVTAVGGTSTPSVGPVDVTALHDRLGRALRAEAESIPTPPTSVRGSLHRTLPTTAAIVTVTPGRGPDAFVVDAVWAGDSRGFVLSAVDGLQALTVDDVRETDALVALRDDPPMTNLLAADREFDLHHRWFERHGPAVLLAATDGCFGYVATPAHFEYLLLDTLLAAEDAADWAARMIDELGRFTADDASFALLSIGYEDFASLRRSFRDRHTALADGHWAPYQAASGAERERLRSTSWSAYRVPYEALQPTRPEST